MIPTYEKELIEEITSAIRILNDNSALYAYPQLQPAFYSLTGNLEVVVSKAIIRQRKELFHGLTPWAKLYKMQTGRDISLPRNIIKKELPDQWSLYSSIPILAILAYAHEHRKIDSLFSSFNDDGTESHFDLNKNNVVVKWSGNDMFLRFDTLGYGDAYIHCPLFHEPYKVEMEMTFVDKNVVEPLYKKLVTEREDSIKVTDPKNLLLHHYFGTVENPIAVPDAHPIKQLAVLFDGCMYSNKGRHWGEIEFNGLIIRFDCDTNINSNVGHPYRYVRLTSVLKQREGETTLTAINDWHKNPLLVNDLLENMDKILEELLDIHELSLKEQNKEEVLANGANNSC